MLVSSLDSNVNTKKYKTIFKKYQCNDIVHKSSRNFETTEILYRDSIEDSYATSASRLYCLRRKYVGGNGAGERQGDDQKIPSHHFFFF